MLVAEMRDLERRKTALVGTSEVPPGLPAFVPTAAFRISHRANHLLPRGSRRDPLGVDIHRDVITMYL